MDPYQPSAEAVSGGLVISLAACEEIQFLLFIEDLGAIPAKL